VLQGIDLPLHAPAEDYRSVVEFIASDPYSLGALVTTHKIDLYHACADLFDEIDQFARLMGETSCISKRDGRLICHAKDPISSGLALDAFMPSGHWSSAATTAVCLGAGGSTIAISWYLSRPETTSTCPERIVVTNRSQSRLDHIREIHETLDTVTAFDYMLARYPEDNDRVVAQAGPGSLVVNATGLGKDAPGSPLSNSVLFPERAIAWDLNYRGDLVFLDQARGQQVDRSLDVQDGWVYFIHGWTQVIAEVFHIAIPTDGPGFQRLSDLARATR
jgi:shikimate 5-dehydrogenase